jgi:hypothetical protein
MTHLQDMRRRGRSPTLHIGTNTSTQPDLLDEDDQDALVKSLEDKSLEQTRRFQRFFSYVGGFALVVSLVFPLMSHEECSTQWLTCLSHSIISATAHGCSVALGQADPHASISKFSQAGVALIAFTVLLWLAGLSKENFDHFHLSLICGNIVTFLGAGLLRWDIENTLRDIKELKGAKYEHKSL